MKILPVLLQKHFLGDYTFDITPLNCYQRSILFCRASETLLLYVCGQHHVHELNKYTSLSGFVRTLPQSSSSSAPDDGFGVYSLDCEMVYLQSCIETINALCHLQSALFCILRSANHVPCGNVGTVLEAVLASQPFGGLVDIAVHLGVKNPNGGGHEWAFSNRTCKILKLLYYKNYYQFQPIFFAMMKTT